MADSAAPARSLIGGWATTREQRDRAIRLRERLWTRHRIALRDLDALTRRLGGVSSDPLVEEVLWTAAAFLDHADVECDLVFEDR